MKWQIILTVLSSLLLFTGHAEAADSSNNEKIQLLIVSLGQYDKDDDILPYVQNDITELQNIFSNRFGAICESCKDSDITLTATGQDKYKESVKNKISVWAQGCKKDSIAILYLGGHGIVDKEGRLCIPMINFDKEHIFETSIPVEWVRNEFRKCQAHKKVLILDACHSGTARSLAKDMVVISKMAEKFNEKDKESEGTDFVTLASSSGNQESWIWQSKKHSLFTYWLIEGLKGSADLDKNNSVSLDEVIKYLKENVPMIAKHVLEKSQTPTVINEQAGENISFRLRPIAKYDCILDIDKRIDTELITRGIKEVCIPEFSAGTSKEDKYKIDRDLFGNLTKGIPDELMTRLSGIGRNEYICINDEETFNLLKEIEIKDFGTSKTRSLKLPNGDPVPAIICGHLYPLNEEGSAVRCECVIKYGKRTTPPIIGIFHTTANVVPKKDENNKDKKRDGKIQKEPDFETIGMSGVSFVRNFANNETAPTRKELHPLSPEYKEDHNFPYDIMIGARKIGSKQGNSGYEIRDFEFKENQCTVTLNQGEEYAVFVQNDSGKNLFYSVLVDGRNTISQPTKTTKKGIHLVPNKNMIETFAPRVNLSEARGYVQEPKSSLNSGTGAIYGFYQPVKEDVKQGQAESVLRRFTIVDVGKSKLDRTKMTEQLGLITIGLFESISKNEGEKGSSGSDKQEGFVVTDPGKKEETKINLYTGNATPGRLFSVINIRYQEAKKQ